MYRQSNVYLGSDARTALMYGVNAVANAVAPTLGAAGSNGIVEAGVYPGHMITNDGITIAQSVVMDDPVENIGANIMKEIASRSDKESGDGTTTSMVLTQAILHEGMNLDENAMEIKRSLDACLPIINKSIDAQTKAITPDEVGAVATISAEDPAMGTLLQKIYKKIGKDGIVELDNSNTFETLFEIKEGVRLRNAGFMAPYMANADGAKAVYKKPKILITKQKIATLQDIDPLFQALSQSGTTELVIFCDDIDPAVVSALAFTHVKGIFKTLIIKAPVLWKDWLFEDFAKITGATIVDPNSGVTLKTLQLGHLGTCEKLVTTKEDTTVIGIQDIGEHVANLMATGEDDMKLRAAWLSTKAAVLKIGANSESELSYKRLKAEDARNASYLALQHGVVAGGGAALFNVVEKLPDTVGGRILREALQAPIRQIVTNAGVAEFPLSSTRRDVDSKKNPITAHHSGFNAKTLEVVDMWEANIIDPSIVVKNAIKNAISVAGTVLTARVVTTLPRQEPQYETASQMPGM